MNQPFLFPEKEKWTTLPSFIEAAKKFPLSPYHRLFLTNGGTLTTALQALLEAPVHIDVIGQYLSEAPTHLLQFLELKESEKGLLREVWILGDQQEKLVFANSFLPLNGLNPSVHEALLSRKYSIGDLIENLKIPSFKDKIGFGILHSESLSKEFQVQKDALLWYRHFRLFSPRYLLASIYEVFSPRLFTL